MTTAWAYAVQGQWAEALHANAGGALLCGVVAVATPWAAATAARGKWMAFRPSPAWLLWIGSGWLTITILDWARKLATS
jgi:xanthine/CO dehydrogenase XdhC/CoxF family maturation factor